MDMRTPLAKVRGLGSAKEGADHFWRQRVTAVSNLVLVIVVLISSFRLIGADHATVKAALKSPLVSLPLLLLIVSGVYHMRLGMQTIIEDYIRAEGPKVIWLMLNTFFAIAVGLTSVVAVLKLFFGA